MPDQPTLPDLERKLEAALTRYTNLRAARPKLSDVLRRAEMAAELDAAIARAAELQAAIAKAPATDIADAAVKLRRLAASLDAETYEKLLPASALAAVEAAAGIPVSTG